MGRRRSSRTRALPPNLYERRGYFSWRDPRNGKELGLGRDKRSAITQAIEANHKIEGTVGKRSLVDRLEVGPNNSVSAFCDLYQAAAVARHEAGKLSLNYIYSIKQQTKLLRDEWGDRRIDTISTRDIADYLSKWEARGKLRMAQAVRTYLKDLFAAAIAKGWLSTNPVVATKVADVEVRRSRLTLQDFQAIHAIALKDFSPWLGSGPIKSLSRRGSL